MLAAVSANATLKKLNISKNFLTNDIARDLAAIIQTRDLEELYLHWNQIKGDGALAIVDALLENDSLNVLDLSWNAFGQGNPHVVPKLCDYLVKNKSLVHLDLSSNFFTLQDCKAIAEAIAKNHTIYGFHFRGNYGWVDARGFLVVDSELFDSVTEPTRIESVE